MVPTLEDEQPRQFIEVLPNSWQFYEVPSSDSGLLDSLDRCAVMAHNLMNEKT